MGRKRIPERIETAVLTRSARRCALCFHLSGKLSETLGQIAHLDKDPSNYAEDNLAYLCLEHHTLLDSKTSQHKNYTVREVKRARKALYEAIAQGQHYRTDSKEGSAPELELAFDPSDDLCTRSWHNEVHHLYRVRLKNVGQIIARHVVAKIESIQPPCPDFLGTHLMVCHQPSAESIDLRPEETAYFDLLEYNSTDAATGGPVLLVWHTVSHLRRDLPDADYEFCVKAYSDEVTSAPVSLAFRRFNRLEYTFTQIPLPTSPAEGSSSSSQHY